MSAIKNIAAFLIAVVGILIALNAFTLVAQSSIHQIYVTCNYILATLLCILSAVMADWIEK